MVSIRTNGNTKKLFMGYIFSVKQKIMLNELFMVCTAHGVFEHGMLKGDAHKFPS
jgi:hypothetical protein